MNKSLNAECVLKEYDALKDKSEKHSVSSYLGLFTIGHVCDVLTELKIDGMGDQRNSCFRDMQWKPERLIPVIRKAQEKLGEPQDGWLRSDQFVRLICMGVDLQNEEARKPSTPAVTRPASDRYAGWMLATGQGLPQDTRVAATLLQRARSALEARQGELEALEKAGKVTDKDERTDVGLALDHLKLTRATLKDPPNADFVAISAACTGAWTATQLKAKQRREKFIGPDVRITRPADTALDVPANAAIGQPAEQPNER